MLNKFFIFILFTVCLSSCAGSRGSSNELFEKIDETATNFINNTPPGTKIQVQIDPWVAPQVVSTPIYPVIQQNIIPHGATASTADRDLTNNTVSVDGPESPSPWYKAYVWYNTNNKDPENNSGDHWLNLPSLLKTPNHAQQDEFTVELKQIMLRSNGPILKIMVESKKDDPVDTEELDN